MLSRLKALVPQPLFQLYHYFLAQFSAFLYGYPSEKLIVIGVTGTNGKTTTSYLIAKALEASGHKTGCTTTAILKVGEREWLNNTKMTMPGRFFLQRMLRDMVKAGCRYAVIETSSQGLIQYRHAGINYDVAVFTNLTPEHIEAHGGFENYKVAKRLLFEHLVSCPVKRIDGRPINKQAVLNADSAHAEFYAATPGLKQISWFGIESRRGLFPEEIRLESFGSSYKVKTKSYQLNLPGKHNIENTLAALATCQALGVSVEAAAQALSGVRGVPGRLERVDAGQPWTVIIDYAPEPESLRRLYEALEAIPHERLIHVLGSCGGGRDVARRPILGRMAGQAADIVIVTNEDPYDDDPQTIIDQVAAGAREAGKIEGHDLFRVTDRREAIFQAMSLVQKGDVVVLTGKGCETWICLAHGKKQPWNEGEVAKEAIKAKLAAVC